MELTRLVRTGGGPWAQSRARTITAVAVALAESGGNPRARGGPNTNGTYDHGLWQINDVHRAQFANRDIYDARVNLDVAQQVWLSQGWGAWSAFPLRSQARMSAARRAYGKRTPCPEPGTESNKPPGLNDRKITDMSTSTVPGWGLTIYRDPNGCTYAWDGETRTYRGYAHQPGAQSDDPLMERAGRAIEDTAWGQAAAVLTWLGDPSNWIRIAYVALGGAVIVAGVVLVASQSKIGQQAVATAGTVARKGR